ADQAEWVPPKFLPTSGQGILFLEELTSAPQMTQAGCYQLVLDRKLGEYCLLRNAAVPPGRAGSQFDRHHGDRRGFLAWIAFLRML
ncbi:MAG TPA: hypothetical protein VK638_00805, partial [Edaphobacter sp.]|nr:hypothetical protein [Edaphobacter sp.]